MKITERVWTRVTPWDVSTSPVDGEMIPVLTFAVQDDARRAVQNHNVGVIRAAAKLDGTGCRECGMPFNNANPTKSSLCAECAA